MEDARVMMREKRARRKGREERGVRCIVVLLFF